MGRHVDDCANADDDGESAASSSPDNDGDDNNKHRERKRTSSKKHKKKRKRQQEHSSKKKKSKKQHQSRRREHADSASDHSEVNSSSSSSSSNNIDDDKEEEEEERTTKRHRKDTKRHRRKEKDTRKSSRDGKKRNSSKKSTESKSQRGRRRNDDDSDNDDDDDNARDDAFARNHALANALLQLLDSHPALVADLPIMLIRLANGTMFDLSQMTDPSASRGLAAVFQCLEPYGVQQQETTTGAWMWKGPQQQQQQQQQQSGGTKNDLVLVRVIRALLDQIGITNDAVEAFESEQGKRMQEAATTLKAPPHTTTTAAPVTSSVAASSGSSSQKDDPIIGQVQQMLSNFGDQNVGLGKELVVLCNMILEGESVALDGLPDERLRKALESLFESCGLEKFEMENDTDDDDDGKDSAGEKEKETPNMGYGLPENDAGSPKETTARVRLESVVTACQQQQMQSPNDASRRVLGPSLPPAGYEQEEESDEEGPQLTADATAAHRRPETADMVRAQAARRARELRAVNAGLSVKDIAAIEDGGGREEWMIVPGQYDFLDCIKSAPIRNRTFQGGSKHDKDKQRHEGPIDPAVQAEMNAISQAHQDSRGPSLFEEHRAAKAAAEAEKKKSGKSNNWKWNRDRDLDEGRRVDKDALNMVMGGAATGLQSKFQGGFGR